MGNMVLRKRVKTEEYFQISSYHDGEIKFQFSLNKKKLIIGSAPNCDIIIDDPSISHYHAFITIDKNGGKIIDLDSVNGILINNDRVKESYFNSGDSLSIGQLQFNVEESTTQVEGNETFFEDQDEGKVEVIKTKETQSNNLPPLPGLVVIDGEYCDIEFNDNDFVPTSTVPAYLQNYSESEFIETQEGNKFDPIAREANHEAFEVVVLSKGNVISVDYFPVKNKTLYVDSLKSKSDTFTLEVLEEDARLPFIINKDGQFIIKKLNGFHCRVSNKDLENPFNKDEEYTFNLDDSFCFTKGTVQVFIKATKAPPSFKSTPFFGKDIAFQKEAGKIFGTIMGVMMLLLFIDTTIETPKKKLSVVFRKAVKSEQKSDTKSKENPDKVNKDNGIREKLLDKPETKMAKKSEPVKEKKVEKKTNPAPPKVAQNTPTPPKAEPVKAPKVKAFEFKMAKNFSNMMKNNNVAVSNVSNIKSSSTSSSSTNFQNTDSKSLNIASNSNVKTLGQDYAGSYDTSSGAKGLSSKSGIDTAYSDPKTVVLGSMDPELLRKILREYLPQFRHCYQKELEVNESAQGVIDLSFRIMANGKTTNANVTSKKGAFGRVGSDCMKKVLALIPFPAPKGGGVVDVKQPLNFFSEKSKY